MSTETLPADSVNSAGDEFARQADQASPGIVREFLQFLAENKKWWLLPILVSVGLITILVALSTTAVAPLIYPLF